MDSLIAKANALGPLKKKRKTENNEKYSKSKSKPHSKQTEDTTLNSVVSRTTIPKSLRSTSPNPEGTRTYSHIHNKKLKTQLTRQSAHAVRSKILLKDAELLLTEEAGTMEAEGEMDRTWRVGQKDIVGSSGQEAARGRKEWKLDGGPYRSRYTRNGRYV